MVGEEKENISIFFFFDSILFVLGFLIYVLVLLFYIIFRIGIRVCSEEIV